MSTEQPHSAYAVNVTAIYDTAQGARLAAEVLDRLNTQVAGDIRFNLCLWRADLLDMPEVYELVRNDAASSMLMAIVCMEENGLGADLQRLLHEWCGERAGTEAALAVLLCGGSAASGFVETLRRVAEYNGLDFICSSSPSELHSSLQAPPAPRTRRHHHAHKGR
jgi:hypothetical protein